MTTCDESLVHAGRFAPWAGGDAALRIAALERKLEGLTAKAVEPRVREIVSAQRHTYARTLPLYAGTNCLDDELHALHDPQIGSRPTMGWPGAKYQAGNDALEELEVLASACVAAVMGGRFAEVRLPSATLANLAVYSAFAMPGDTIGTLSAAAGGHTSHHAEGVAGVRGLHVAALPYAPNDWDVDLAVLHDWLRATGPKLVVVGASLMLFPHRLQAIADAAHATGALLVYDASHMAGLVAGGRFQQPLAEGADILTFSTYKSFGAPAGGAVVTSDPALAARISDVVYPALTANYDASRLAPLAVRAANLVDHGAAYADRCIATARLLSRRLSDSGLTVAGAERGFTQSHHIAVDVRAGGGSPAAVARLTERGIQASAIHLPDQDDADSPAALRFGTQELVRRGLDHHVDSIADLVSRALLRDEPPSTVRGAVAALVERGTSSPPPFDQQPDPG